MPFDIHQFAGRKQYPVSARKTVGGWISTGLDFSDYSKMHTQQRLLSGERRLPTPDWAVNNLLCQRVLVEFMEERAGFRKQQTGDLKERLETSRLRIMSQRENLIRILDGLCSRYVNIKNGKAGETSDDEVGKLEERIRGKRSLLIEWSREWLQAYELRYLEVEIEGIDTYLRYTTNGGADVIASIITLYYRVRMDSVGVGAELSLKPPHVRQLLSRLNETAVRIFPQEKMKPLPIPSPLFDNLEID